MITETGRVDVWEVTVRHLPEGMDARVGPGGADHRYLFLEEPEEGLLEDFLNGEAVRLNLPSLVVRPLVLEGQLESHTIFETSSPPRAEIEGGDPDL